MSNSLFSIAKIIEEKYNGNVLGTNCLEEKLSIEKDSEINKEKLKTMVYLYELGNPLNKNELDYIEAKIIKFITSDPFELAKCFELYSISSDVVCNPHGLSGDLLYILSNLLNLKRDLTIEEKFNDNMMVIKNRLGKYLPDILKMIIDISENYEKNNCQKISENTILMKNLYSMVIKRNVASENYKMFDIDLDKYFDSFQDNIITKIAFLIFIAYIIGKIINTFKVEYKV